MMLQIPAEVMIPRLRQTVRKRFRSSIEPGRSLSTLPSTSTHIVRHLPHYYFMSSTFNTTPTSSNFQALFNAALTDYTKQTGQDLRDHPLASRIDRCDNPGSILDVFQEQARAFDESRRGDTKLFNWFKSIVKVLHALSTNEVLSEGASSVCSPTFVIIILDSIPKVFPPAKAVFSGIGILLSVRFFLLISAQLFIIFSIARRLRM
jgi:hypothetical protein